MNIFTTLLVICFHFHFYDTIHVFRIWFNVDHKDEKHNQFPVFNFILVFIQICIFISCFFIKLSFFAGKNILSKINFDAPFIITLTLTNDDEQLEEFEQLESNENFRSKNNTENQNILSESKNPEHRISKYHMVETNENSRVLNNAKTPTDPLDIVSDNMINYIKLSNYYKSQNVNDSASLYQKIRDTKKLYFNLCHNIVLDCILSRVDEPNFIKNFVLKTLERSKMDITWKQIHDLVNELVLWSQQRNELILKNMIRCKK